MRILVVDNYDSFTFNLVQLVRDILQKWGKSSDSVWTPRNDQFSIGQVEEFQPDRILISPGPGSPSDGGQSRGVIERFFDRTPILGVCLGHQIIASMLGATVSRAFSPVHGKTATIEHDGIGLFESVPSPTAVARYHSLIVSESTLPAELTVTARTPSGEVMGIRHTRCAIEGVQFHPESFLTEHGAIMMENFLR